MKLIELVDEDGSGKIEFDEFLGMMQQVKRVSGDDNDHKKVAQIFSFFKSKLPFNSFFRKSKNRLKNCSFNEKENISSIFPFKPKMFYT